jgi:hypothetical protein
MATVKKSAKKMQAGGVASKKVKAPMVDPKGAWTKVQERTLGNMKKGGSIKKAQVGRNIAIPEASKKKVVPPTPDSSDYFMKKMTNAGVMELSTSGDIRKRFQQSFYDNARDLKRQENKGKPGYDKNGYPRVQKKTSGGKLSKKK